jgi:hypothetical protein
MCHWISAAFSIPVLAAIVVFLTYNTIGLGSFSDGMPIGSSLAIAAPSNSCWFSKQQRAEHLDVSCEHGWCYNVLGGSLRQVWNSCNFLIDLYETTENESTSQQ